MRRFFREIGIVIIEISNAAAVGESGPVRRRLVRRADHGRAMFGREIRSDIARDRARLFVPGPERAAQRIHQPAFNLMDHVLREVLEIQRAGEMGELMRESRLSHKKVKLQSGDESPGGKLTGQRSSLCRFGDAKRGYSRRCYGSAAHRAAATEDTLLFVLRRVIRG